MDTGWDTTPSGFLSPFTIWYQSNSSVTVETGKKAVSNPTAFSFFGKTAD
jgi:hypothetical protein